MHLIAAIPGTAGIPGTIVVITGRGAGSSEGGPGEPWASLLAVLVVLVAAGTGWLIGWLLTRDL